VDSALDVEHKALRALYAFVIPYAWALRGGYPVLVDDGFSCDDVGSGDYDQIFPDDNDKAAACVDNKNYFLLSPAGPSRTCKTIGNWAVRCEDHPMTLLKGYETLGEKGDLDQEQWGGITRGNIVKRYVTSIGSKHNFAGSPNVHCFSILTRFAIKGNRDLDQPADATNPGGRSQLWDQISGGDIVSLPGIVQIPKCGQQEVWDNWLKATAGQDMDNIEYPCNPS
jgi:hypothetical protein